MLVLLSPSATLIPCDVEHDEVGTAAEDAAWCRALDIKVAAIRAMFGSRLGYECCG